MKLPGDGLGGGGLPPGWGQRGPKREQKVGDRLGLQERLTRGPSKPRLGKLGLRKQEGMTASGRHRAGGLQQAKDGGRQVGHLTCSAFAESGHKMTAGNGRRNAF